VLSPDGTARLLGDEEPELLLGVAPQTKRREHVTLIEAGSTVLLYTDGLVERRDRDLDAGARELCAVLEQCAGLPLDELCDAVLERLFLPDAQDDVALLAVRLYPEDAPRPPDAGPQRVPANIEPTPHVVPRA
jgi:serine phosphatase RsbU (regulator of sigma subunit)